MTTKILVSSAAFAITLVGGGVGAGYYISHRSSPPSYSCVAGPDELCASDQFFSDYQRWKTLKADLAKQQESTELRDLQNKSDQLSGMTTRLSQQIPQGYAWDEKKSRFVKASPSAPPPAVKK